MRTTASIARTVLASGFAASLALSGATAAYAASSVENVLEADIVRAATGPDGVLPLALAGGTLLAICGALFIARRSRQRV